MRVKVALKTLACSLKDLFFPRLCAGCFSAWLPPDGGFWCRQCLETLHWIRSPRCPRCGRPFLKSTWNFDHLCGECRIQAPPFTSARSAVAHAGVARDRINQLKFSGQIYWAPALAQLLEHAVQSREPGSFDCIVAVPLHHRRLRQRGFNQSGLIAGMLGKSLRCPVRFDLLARSQWTEPQTRLSRRERLRNVRNAFSAAQPEQVKNRSILLVDDVFTTGTTLAECSKALKKAGASEVHAVTISRSLPELRIDVEKAGIALEL